jgi:hypothetical protein
MAKRQLYTEVAGIADEPIARRGAVAQGRGENLKIPRRYHLSAEKLISLRKRMAEENKFISPYGENRLYTYIIDSLVSLGIDQAHPIGAVWAKFQEISSKPETMKGGKTAWQRFSERETRNADTGLDDFSRFVQNIEVLQRFGGITPYGLKLAQVGACIDVLVEMNGAYRGMIKIQLRTGIADGDPVKPVNLNRKRAYTKTVDSLPAGMLIQGDYGMEAGAD